MMTMSDDINDRIAALFAELESCPIKPHGARKILAPFRSQELEGIARLCLTIRIITGVICRLYC